MQSDKAGHELSLCTLQIANKFYKLRSDFARFPKFCKANIFDFQINIFYKWARLAVSWEKHAFSKKNI